MTQRFGLVRYLPRAPARTSKATRTTLTTRRVYMQNRLFHLEEDPDDDTRVSGH